MSIAYVSRITHMNVVRHVIPQGLSLLVGKLARRTRHRRNPSFKLMLSLVGCRCGKTVAGTGFIAHSAGL